MEIQNLTETLPHQQVYSMSLEKMTAERSDTVFYTKGKDYWEMVPPTIDGMLGGFSEISNIDIQASARFLNTFLQSKQQPVGHGRALDCGSGIGRITKHLLLKHFDKVDMVEQNQRFLDHAKDYIGPEAGRIGKLICCGLQDFIPKTKCTYDVIWCQWVTGHLTDDHFIMFLKRCKAALKENGIIVIKDNLSSVGVDMDNQDSSVTRPRSLFVKLFANAGLELVAERKQYKFPKGLYEVKMFALR